jgi:hypothetical protein
MILTQHLHAQVRSGWRRCRLQLFIGVWSRRREQGPVRPQQVLFLAVRHKLTHRWKRSATVTLPRYYVAM